jgi:hypothetical protein
VAEQLRGKGRARLGTANPPVQTMAVDRAPSTGYSEGSGAVVKRTRARSTTATARASDIRGYDLSDLWKSNYARFRKSRKRIAEAGQLRRGEIRPHVPPDIENADAFRVTIPHSLLMVQNIIQYLVRKQPGIRRPSKAGPVATRLSDKVEHWLGAPGKSGALGELQAGGEGLWESYVAHGANDGEYGLLVLPRPASWSHLLDYTEPDDNDPSGEKICAYFQRDAEGRDPDDAFYADSPHKFKLDEVESAKAFDDYEDDARARALPFVVEVLSADICLPIGVDPSTGKVDAMLIRTVRSVRSLKALGFDWDVIGPADAPSDEGGAYSPTSVLLGGGLEVTLYELVVPGGIFYQVGEAPSKAGQSGAVYPTYLRKVVKREQADPESGDDTEVKRTAAFVNLAETYGITEVPGGYFYGAHHPSERDPDKKGIPLLSIFSSLILGVNQTVSSLVHHAYEVGFGGWFADPSQVDPKYWTEQGKPMKVKVHRGSVSYVAGKITPAVHAGVDKDVSWFVTMALNLLERFGPAQAMTSGDPSDGGFSQAVAQASGENALGQILAGSMAAMKRTCECLLEQASSISDLLGEPIPVYTRYDPKTQSHHDLLPLSTKDLMGDFGVEVIFPMRKGSNLPLAQGMFQWWKGGALSLYTWLQEGWGEEQPDEEVDRINVETALKSPDGQKLVWSLAAKIQGDSEMTTIAGLQQAGKMGPGGTPTALLPPRPLAQADGGVPPGQAGAEVGNTATAALGGIMAGAMGTGPQARVAAATGAPAQMPAGGVAAAPQMLGQTT